MLRKQCLKGLDHSIVKILSSVVQPHITSNLYDVLSSMEHKRYIFQDCPGLCFPYNGSE